MGKEIIKFGDTEFEKCKFHHDKNPSFLNDVNIAKRLLSIKKIKIFHWLLRRK